MDNKDDALCQSAVDALRTIQRSNDKNDLILAELAELRAEIAILRQFLEPIPRSR